MTKAKQMTIPLIEGKQFHKILKMFETSFQEVHRQIRSLICS